MSEYRHKIRPLDPSVVGKIAAGEVVERPAYAIKELVENSIDAGATAVSIDMQDGGLTSFRVTDNGCGIAPEDIRMAFTRHATSKLRRAEELDAIHTLGFRGEALASVAAVGRVTMLTRAAGRDVGVKAVVEGGAFAPIQEAASPEGTSITVRDLFYNVPARRKFLKKPSTEAGLVSDLVMRLILSRPDISFRLTSAERQVYHSPGNGSLRDALFSVLGKQALASLVEVRGSAAGCAIYGYVGIGEAARGNRGMQTFILNGRYVRSGVLSQALEEACRERVMIGKYPVCALQLTMPFENVDVNVHPNKLEVRFSHERDLADGLREVIRSAFVVEPLKAAPAMAVAPMAEVEAPQTSLKPQPMMPSDANRQTVRVKDAGQLPRMQANRPPVVQGFAPAAVPQQGPRTAPPPPPEQTTMEAAVPTRTPLHVLGVAWYEYVFAEQDDTIYIIDQHAAHERILYERFQQAMDRDTVSQALLVPQVVQLTHREHTVLMAHLDDLRAAGFDLDDFGGQTIQVRAVPAILGIPTVQAFFGELADRLEEFKTLPTQEQRRDALVKHACRKAVKAGDPLPNAAIEALLEEMRATGAPPTCPHGRPLVISIHKTELDKRFRRIV